MASGDDESDKFGIVWYVDRRRQWIRRKLFNFRRWLRKKIALGEPDYDTGSEEQKSETVDARVSTWRSSAQSEALASRNRRRASEVDELGVVHELGVSGLAQEGREWFARPLHPQVPTSENAGF